MDGFSTNQLMFVVCRSIVACFGVIQTTVMRYREVTNDLFVASVESIRVKESSHNDIPALLPLATTGNSRPGHGVVKISMLMVI